MFKDFKQFLLRGNVVDLAVAIVIGTAFGLVVAALVKDLVTPIIAAVIGKPDFSALSFTINGSTFHYGDFINAVLAFVSIALAVFLFVVKPVNAVKERAARGRARDRARRARKTGPERRSTMRESRQRLAPAAGRTIPSRPFP